MLSFICAERASYYLEVPEQLLPESSQFLKMKKQNQQLRLLKMNQRCQQPENRANYLPGKEANRINHIKRTL
jgi:hypothetical protein